MHVHSSLGKSTARFPPQTWSSTATTLANLFTLHNINPCRVAALVTRAIATKQSGIDSNDDGGKLDSALQLHNHMQALPQELFDRIYDLTVTADSKIRIYAIGKDIKELKDMTAVPDHFDIHIPVNERLPPLFHVDRQSRQKFAESYFGHPESLFVFYGASVGRMCFESSHLRLISHPHYIYPSSRRYTSPESCHQLLLKLGWEQATANSCQFHTQGKLPELLDEHLWGKTFGVTKRTTEPDVNDHEHN